MYLMTFFRGVVLGSGDEAEALGYAEAVVLSVSDDEDDTGLSCIMDEFLMSCGQTDDVANRRAGNAGSK